MKRRTPFFERYLPCHEGGWELLPDVIPCLDRLAAQDLGIISNGNSAQQRQKPRDLTGGCSAACFGQQFRQKRRAEIGADRLPDARVNSFGDGLLMIAGKCVEQGVDGQYGLRAFG